MQAATMNDPDKIKLAASELTQDLINPPSFEALRERCGLSEFHLKRGFQNVFQTTVAGYLRRQRMLRAADLLRTPGRTVAHVAAEVGFRNPSRFAEAFRRELGCNPAEYRRSDGGGNGGVDITTQLH